MSAAPISINRQEDRSMIAAIYARKSTEQGDRADEEKSVARQIERARAYATRKGWRVDDAHVYVDDAISGAEFQRRPDFLRLMNALRPRAPFQVLVVMDEDRIGRESIETAYILKQFIVAGVRVFSYLQDRERTLDSPTEKLLLSVTAFADEMEREKARQRTYDAMRRKAEAGHVTGGVVFGYANVRANGHVERAIAPPEAAVVRRIFELTADGASARRIALTLNAEGALAPPPRRPGRPRAWSPSTVRAILTRPLYRGEVIWSRSQKRNTWGVRQRRRRAAAEWVRRENPALRIIDENLWQAVAARSAETRRAYVRTTGGRLHGRPPSGVESRYLLTGLATCGLCGGSLVVMSRTSGDQRKFLYRCQHAYYRGPTICANRRPLAMLQTNEAVLRSLEAALLTPAAVEAIVREVLAAMRPAEDTAVPRRAALRADLLLVEGEISRLTAAIARAPDLGSLLDALRATEQRRARLAAELAGLDSLGLVRTLDPAALTPAILAKLDVWAGLMERRVAQARQILRHLLVGRIAFTPQADGTVAFVGHGSIEALIAGTVLAPLSKAGVSPTGFEPVFPD
jgi:site-specific DNA recombinase